MFVGILARAGVLLAIVAAPAVAQSRIAIRLVHPDAEHFVFQPVRVVIKPGDILEFTVESGGPYVIGFEPADFGPREKSLMDAAMPDRPPHSDPWSCRGRAVASNWCFLPFPVARIASRR
jgi:hypothetical protein